MRRKRVVMKPLITPHPQDIYTKLVPLLLHRSLLAVAPAGTQA